MSSAAWLDPAAWDVVNDGVMGGISRSRVTGGDGFLRFSGTVQLEFNGGFASIRRSLPSPLPVDAPGLSVTVRGDGNRYRLTLYTRDPRSRLVNPFNHYAVFEAPAGRVQTGALRWPQFAATYRGRAVPDAPPVAAVSVIGVGVMITKAEHAAGSGDFTLDLLAIEPLAPAARS